jgi:PAS domain S-box-containing protein
MPPRSFAFHIKSAGSLSTDNAHNYDCAMMHLAQNVTDYAIYLLDTEGRVVSWNAGAKRLKGYEFEEVFGRHYSMFFTPDAIAAGLPQQQLDAAVRDERFEMKGWRQRKDGQRFWALVTLTAIHAPNGKLTGFAKITRDITLQKMLEDEMKDSSLELEKRIRERTWQLEAIAEELRIEKATVQGMVVTIRKELDEKEVLLREVYHRVKNNMQVVQSLLKMGARTITSGDGRNAIAAAVERVQIMATVHERLYQSPELAGLTLASFLREIVEGAIAANTPQATRINLQMEFDEIPLSIDHAIPLGLLVNELISNCLKHGLPKNRPGTIHISARNIQGAVRLVIRDNGNGLPENFEVARKSSMGLKLVESLARQLGGEIKFLSNDGCEVQANLVRLVPRPGQHQPTAVSNDLQMATCDSNPL